jgi:5-methylcytosine-specific restriction endonuclease McrA
VSRDVRKHARFYYDDFQHDYPSVFDDEAALGTWVRLLVIAERSWPASPELPRSIKPRLLRVLVEAGLVALGPHYTFALKGHNAERTRRSEMASQSATLRWNRPKVEGGKPASRSTRFKVLERDGYRCRYCGRTSDEIALDVDHVVPVREGGTDDLDNLVSACVDCNSGKSGHPARAPHAKDARALLEQETDETRRDSPPPPAGKRANGTNPRALGTNPRAQGTSPRQERDREKRSPMPESVHLILERARKGA